GVRGAHAGAAKELPPPFWRRQAVGDARLANRKGSAQDLRGKRLLGEVASTRGRFTLERRGSAVEMGSGVCGALPRLARRTAGGRERHTRNGSDVGKLLLFGGRARSFARGSGLGRATAGPFWRAAIARVRGARATRNDRQGGAAARAREAGAHLRRG